MATGRGHLGLARKQGGQEEDRLRRAPCGECHLGLYVKEFAGRHAKKLTEYIPAPALRNAGRALLDSKELALGKLCLAVFSVSVRSFFWSGSSSASLSSLSEMSARTPGHSKSASHDQQRQRVRTKKKAELRWARPCSEARRDTATCTAVCYLNWRCPISDINPSNLWEGAFHAKCNTRA